MSRLKETTHTRHHRGRHGNIEHETNDESTPRKKKNLSLEKDSLHLGGRNRPIRFDIFSSSPSPVPVLVLLRAERTKTEGKEKKKSGAPAKRGKEPESVPYLSPGRQELSGI